MVVLQSPVETPTLTKLKDLPVYPWINLEFASGALPPHWVREADMAPHGGQCNIG
jgi:hypothetical protein